MILDKEYFQSEDTPQLARNLIGKNLCRDINGTVSRHIISEVEAYHGHTDKASHARFGKTQRNTPMFGAAGYTYVYLCYGIHWLLNIVTGPEDFPAAILIRGIDDIFGPGKVTAKLNIDGELNNKILLPQSGLWVEDSGYTPDKISISPRIGIGYAQEYRNAMWRFKLG